jgi:hypothetical protein
MFCNCYGNIFSTNKAIYNDKTLFNLYIRIGIIPSFESEAFHAFSYAVPCVYVHVRFVTDSPFRFMNFRFVLYVLDS